MRNYELMFVADPRLTDEEFVAISDDYKRMLTEGGVEIVAEESWGRRKLAYPIGKLNEGRYMVLFLTGAGKNPLPAVEHRMRQNEKILRYLTVRTEAVHRTPVAGPEDEAPRRRFDEDGPPRRGGRYDDDGGGRRGGGRYDDDRPSRRDADED